MGLIVRAVGLQAPDQIDLTNLAYNMCRIGRLQLLRLLKDLLCAVWPEPPSRVNY